MEIIEATNLDPAYWRKMNRCANILAQRRYPSLILQHISLLSMKTNNSLRFALFIRKLPIDFSLLGRKRKYVISKTTAKFKGKQTSIVAVKDQFLAFATFPIPLLSRYRLPLKDICWGKSFHVVFCTCRAWGLGFYILSGIYRSLAAVIVR